VAETITNNMRKVIIDGRPLNPEYYDRICELLDALLKERRKGALEYKDFPARLLEHAAKLGKGESDSAYPEWADNGARRALYDLFYPDLNLLVDMDKAVRHSKRDSWVGNKLKEKKVRQAIRAALQGDFKNLDELFDLVKARDEYH